VFAQLFSHGFYFCLGRRLAQHLDTWVSLVDAEVIHVTEEPSTTGWNDEQVLVRLARSSADGEGLFVLVALVAEERRHRAVSLLIADGLLDHVDDLSARHWTREFYLYTYCGAHSGSP